jgi:hypothetical protein
MTRLVQYLSGRPFWDDELFLRTNLMSRSYGELLNSLDNVQAALIGFLWVSKSVALIAGYDEYALRFYPLVMGLGCTVLLYLLCLRIAPKSTPFVLFLFAVSNIFIYYTSEFKPYSSDAFFALLLWLLILIYIQEHSRSALITWSLIGMIAVWFSYPVVFVISGIGLVLILLTAWRRQFAKSGRLIFACSIPAISFMIAYALFYQHVARGSDLSVAMLDYWQQSFVSLTPSSLLSAFFEVFTWLSGLNQFGLLIIVLAFFIVGLLNMRLLHTAILLSPCFMTIIASMLQYYPFRNRLILFLLPAFMIIIGYGASKFYQDISTQHRWISNVLMAMIAIAYMLQLNVMQDTLGY